MSTSEPGDESHDAKAHSAHRRRPIAPLALPAVATTLSGIAVAVGWHYTVPRQTIDAYPPAPEPGKIGYIFTYDYQEHVFGPDWNPTIWAFPATGFIVGAVLAAIVLLLRSVRTPRIGFHASTFLTAAAGGLIVGALAARYAHLQPPRIYVRFVIDPSFSDYGPTGLPRVDIYGAPLLYDRVPPYLLLPALGMATAVALVGVILAISKLWPTPVSNRSAAQAE